MKRTIERCETLAAELERGSAISVDPMTTPRGWRAVAWSRDGTRELAVGIGPTRSDAARWLLQRLRMLVASAERRT